jgi:hypothetical protein
LQISSFSTTVPSFAQMYCCFRREPHLVWIILKLIAAEDSLEEKRLTGTETSPKEIVAEPMVRAGMEGLIYVQELDLARGGWGGGMCRFLQYWLAEGGTWG